MPDAPPADGDESVPLIWRWLPLRLALAALPLAPTFTVLAFNVGPFIRSIAAVTLGVTLISPVHGLLLTAAIAPFGELLAASIGATNFRISEVVVLAFLTGWLLRWLPDRRGPRVAAPAAGWLFAITVAASIAGLAWQLGRYPGELPATIDQVVHGYFYSFERIGLVDGARLLEGMALAAATVILFRRHPTLANTLPFDARRVRFGRRAVERAALARHRDRGGAAALPADRLPRQRARRRRQRRRQLLRDDRVRRARHGAAQARSAARRSGWCLAAASGIGLWFSESRSALGAAARVVIVAALWAATSRFSTRARAAALAVDRRWRCSAARPSARGCSKPIPTYRGGGFRQQFVQTSVRMIARAAAVRRRRRAVLPDLAALSLAAAGRGRYGVENAHNFFLQVGGELGLVGLGLFAIWLGAALARAARALARAPRDARLLGAAGGVAVFIITCLTGHPFLVGEVAYPFWMLFGLMTALAGPTLLSDTGGAGDRSRASADARGRRCAAGRAAAIVNL